MSSSTDDPRREPRSRVAIRRVAEIRRGGWAASLDESSRIRRVALDGLAIPATTRALMQASGHGASDRRGSDASYTTVALVMQAAHRVDAAKCGGDRTSNRHAPSERGARLVQPAARDRGLHESRIVARLLLVITTNLCRGVGARKRSHLEKLNVTPLARWELIVGKLLPYAIIGMIDVLLVVSVAVFWFELPVRGSVPLLLGMSLVYLMSTLGLGLFVSTISSTQQQAMMTTTFFLLLPMVFLSGFVFPIRTCRVDPAITYLIPLRYSW